MAEWGDVRRQRYPTGQNLLLKGFFHPQPFFLFALFGEKVIAIYTMYLPLSIMINLLKILLIILAPCPILANSTFSIIPPADKNIKYTASKKTKKEFPYRQIITFYPAKAMANYMLAGYERQVGPKHALKIAVGYANFEEQNLQTGFNNDIKNFSGTRFDLIFKYFAGKDPVMFNGLYIAPYISFKNSNFKYEIDNNIGFNIWEEGSASSLITGFIFGLHAPLGSSFCVDLYLGNAMQKSSGDYKQASRFMDSYRSSIGVISGLSIGFGL